MKKSNQSESDKVVKIESARKKKQEKSSLMPLLTDTVKSAFAIQNKTCLLCNTKKMCVNKTGLCASCYNELSPREKKIADDEAQHKNIIVKVTDDRWKKKGDK